MALKNTEADAKWPTFSNAFFHFDGKFEFRLKFHQVQLTKSQHFDGLVQERRKSSALAMELRLSCTNLSIVSLVRLYSEITSRFPAITGRNNDVFNTSKRRYVFVLT